MIRRFQKFKKQRITATKAVVQYERPWYVRVLALLAAFLAGVLLATFFRIAVLEDSLRVADNPKLVSDLEKCRQTLQNTQSVNAEMRDGSLDELAQKLEACDAEKSRLKEDLTLFETLSSPSTRPGEAEIKDLTLTQTEPGVYHYQTLVAYSPPQRRGAAPEAFTGTLWLSAEDLKTRKTIVITGDGGILSPAVELKITNFQRLSGSFTLPSDTRLRLFRARIRKNGRVVDTKTQDITPDFYQ